MVNIQIKIVGHEIKSKTKQLGNYKFEKDKQTKC